MNSKETKTKKITKFKIIEREDIKGNQYHIIFDNDNEGGKNAYFCWSNSLKTGLEDLQKNKEKMKSIEVEYIESEKGNRVIHLFSDTKQEDFLIF